MFDLLTKPVSALLRMLPSQCAVCRNWSAQDICPPCLASFAAKHHRCLGCAIRLPSASRQCGACLRSPPSLDHAITAADYAFPWNELIQRFKFHDAIDLSQSLAERIAQTVLDTQELPSIDWLLPVPLAQQRLQERGYNQTELLTKHLSTLLACPTRSDWLLRQRHTPDQLTLARDARAANVRHVFAIEPKLRDQIQNARVAVIDDVMTTGATLNEIARVLKQAGAAHVQGWVIARTPNPAG